MVKTSGVPTTNTTRANLLVSPSSIEPERDGSVQNKEKVAIEGSDGTGRLPRAASPRQSIVKRTFRFN